MYSEGFFATGPPLSADEFDLADLDRRAGRYTRLLRVVVVVAGCIIAGFAVALLLVLGPPPSAQDWSVPVLFLACAALLMVLGARRLPLGVKKLSVCPDAVELELDSSGVIRQGFSDPDFSLKVRDIRTVRPQSDGNIPSLFWLQTVRPPDVLVPVPAAAGDSLLTAAEKAGLTLDTQQAYLWPLGGRVCLRWTIHHGAAHKGPRSGAPPSGTPPSRN